MTGRSRGFGFVELSSDEAIPSILEAVAGRELDGRPLRVNEAQDRSARRLVF